MSENNTNIEVETVAQQCPQAKWFDAFVVLILFGISQVVGGGLVGFLATLALSPIIGAIQNGGNMIFGMNIYAQQIVSLIASLFCILTFFFVKKAFIKK